MTQRRSSAHAGRHRFVRLALLALGWLLVLASPLVGILPGPGGVFVFAGGAVLLLRNSRAARRGYVRLQRRPPKLGYWMDRALRRPRPDERRARRRHARGD